MVKGFDKYMDKLIAQTSAKTDAARANLKRTVGALKDKQRATLGSRLTAEQVGPSPDRADFRKYARLTGKKSVEELNAAIKAENTWANRTSRYALKGMKKVGPVRLGLGLGLGAAFAAPPVIDFLHSVLGGGLGNVYREVTGNNPLGPSFDEQIRAVVEEARQAQEAQNEAGRLEDLKRINMARLERMRPDLVTQLVAGRELPQEAVVFGGQKKVSNVEQFAQMMAQGGRSGAVSLGASEIPGM